MGFGEIDYSELRSFCHDLQRASFEITLGVVPVVERGALNIKNQMRSDFLKSSNKGFRHVAFTVRYDSSDGGLTQDIEREKPEGLLANIAYFGSATGGGTVADPKTALDAETPRFIEYLEKVVEEQLRGRR